jgi:superfamily II DNA helicase RecQ
MLMNRSLSKCRKCRKSCKAHPQMSKSLDGYYQETGRAGRDGKKSDCILFYRGQDASRLSSLIYADAEGPSKRKALTTSGHY